ncbi:hypothetical protein Hanom_Chr12g01142121 [Helianthus anomalus]
MTYLFVLKILTIDRTHLKSCNANMSCVINLSKRVKWVVNGGLGWQTVKWVVNGWLVELYISYLKFKRVDI